MVNKSINEFSQKDLLEIANSFSNTDANELALSTMGLNANSNNKKVFGQIIITAIQSSMNYAGDEATEVKSIRQLMKVFFNSGIPVIMR